MKTKWYRACIAATNIIGVLAVALTANADNLGLTATIATINAVANVAIIVLRQIADPETPTLGSGA